MEQRTGLRADEFKTRTSQSASVGQVPRVVECDSSKKPSALPVARQASIAVRLEGVPLDLQMKDESVGGDQTKVPMIVAT